ncbi:hypothetical protein PM082_019711 [Marasmius tenuissimus]|nr:hypothetical protein PM082_019711 [Marasmius tenuissimus]
MSPSTTLSETSENGLYNLRLLLSGHSGAVACVAAHPDGTFVATGGEEGTRIWDLRTGLLVNSPTGAGDRGITTAVVFITKRDGADDAIAFGTDDGYLCIWKRGSDEKEFEEIFSSRLTGGQDGQEISAMAFDASSSQLAVVHRASVVHRFFVDAAMIPHSMKSCGIPHHWPQAVAFGQTGVKGIEIWSFGREDGEIHIMDESGSIIKTWPTASVIGHAVLSVRDDTIVLDDITQGVALYKLTGRSRIKTFPVLIQKKHRSRNVAFHDGGSSVLSGSDHGIVYIFDRRTGDITDTIDIGVKDWVQSITSIVIDGSPSIVVGRTGENIGRTKLQVWTKRSPKNPTESSEPIKRVATIFERGRWILCTMLAVLFILQNVLDLPIRRWLKRVFRSMIAPHLDREDDENSSYDYL